MPKKFTKIWRFFDIEVKVFSTFNIESRVLSSKKSFIKSRLLFPKTSHISLYDKRFLRYTPFYPHCQRPLNAQWSTRGWFLSGSYLS